MNGRTFYRLVTCDIDQKTDIHWFEADSHKDAIVHAANHIKVSNQSIWSAKVITMDGTLMVDVDGQLIEEEKVIAENKKFIEDEFGIRQLELGKEAYDLFKNLYDLSCDKKEVLTALVLLKQRFEEK